MLKCVIAYGVDFGYIDVTQIIIDSCINSNIAYITDGEHRRIALFSNHLLGVLKHVFIKIRLLWKYLLITIIRMFTLFIHIMPNVEEITTQ